MITLQAELVNNLLDGAPIAIIVIVETGFVVFANREAELLFGCQRDEIVGQRISNLIDLDDPRLTTPKKSFETTGYRRDHKAFSATVATSTVTTDTGLYILATVRDVTERIEGEAEARREKSVAEQVRLVAETVRLAAEGEKSVAEHVRLVAEADRLTAEGEKSVAEVKRVKAEGEKSVAEQVRQVAETEHKRIEVQLNQSQRMASLGELAGGVAHDFNNLLAVILNYASFVAEELASAPNNQDPVKWPSMLEDMTQIQIAAERARLLTHQLLSFARREIVQARSLSLNSAITRMEQILRRTIGEQIELDISLAKGLPMVIADPGQIEQIILNLSINARDAMASGGTLTINTSVRHVLAGEFSAEVPEGEFVCFLVSDNGAGMSPEVLDRAFEPFFTTKPRGEGSGLGLATVYGIVSQSGGFLKIESQVGVGTSIVILLPFAPEEAVADSLEGISTPPTPTGGGETIMVVDDEGAVREVTRRILTRNGYRVITALGGEQALQIAQSTTDRIDLLITDVIMPGMQGPSVAREFQKLRPDVRVLFISGHALPVLEAESLLGTDFVLLDKPFDQATLLQYVREVLDSDVQ